MSEPRHPFNPKLSAEDYAEQLERLSPLTRSLLPEVPTATDRLPGSPTVAYAPTELTGPWAFEITVAGHRQRMRHDELVALYRDCDAALNDERKAVVAAFPMACVICDRPGPGVREANSAGGDYTCPTCGCTIQCRSCWSPWVDSHNPAACTKADDQ